MSLLWLTLLICTAQAEPTDAQPLPAPADATPSEPAADDTPAAEPTPEPTGTTDGPLPAAPASTTGADSTLDGDPAIEGEPTEDAPALAPDPPEEVAPAPLPTELERAKEAYFDGGHTEAIEILTGLRQRIDAGEFASPKTRGEIGIYLGELLLLLGDQGGAWKTFRWLLLEQPDYPILPALHPPEVVSWFEAARAEVQAEIEANRPPPPPIMVPVPYPWWGFAPLGIPQLGQGFGARGALFATGQTLAVGTSVGMFAHLLVVNRRNHPDWLTDDEVAPYVRRWRNTVQWPSTAAFYALWVASVIDGRASWERAGRVVPQIVPTQGGGELRFSGRF